MRRFFFLIKEVPEIFTTIIYIFRMLYWKINKIQIENIDEQPSNRVVCQTDRLFSTMLASLQFSLSFDYIYFFFVYRYFSCSIYAEECQSC